MSKSEETKPFDPALTIKINHAAVQQQQELINRKGDAAPTQRTDPAPLKKIRGSFRKDLWTYNNTKDISVPSRKMRGSKKDLWPHCNTNDLAAKLKYCVDLAESTSKQDDSRGVRDRY